MGQMAMGRNPDKRVIKIEIGKEIRKKIRKINLRKLSKSKLRN